MKNLIKKAAALAVTVVLALSVNAQREKGGSVQVSGDFVSSYVWRGVYQGAQACVQPALGFTAGGFSLTAWGSTGLADLTEGSGHKELDLTLAYSFNRFTVQIADLWWAGQGSRNYFHWAAHDTQHHLEAGLSYVLPYEKFPLNISWYTVIFGDDREADGKQNYSSYAELNYLFTVKGIDLQVTLGVVPYKSLTPGMGYDVDGFAVTNVALKATKELRLSQAFSLPVYAQLIFNPAHEDAHLVLGFTLR